MLTISSQNFLEFVKTLVSTVLQNNHAVCLLFIYIGLLSPSPKLLYEVFTECFFIAPLLLLSF
jgi:hypothetical protein